MYLTQALLMEESERTIRERVFGPDEIGRQVCTQLLGDDSRYQLWHKRHADWMRTVARLRNREKQVLTLRAISVRQVQRTALGRYLHDRAVSGDGRDRILAEFYGVRDPDEAALAEDRNYLLSAASAFCVTELLGLLGDDSGIELAGVYERAYTEYFRMFCDRLLAVHAREPYLLEALIPEARARSERLRQRVLGGEELVITSSSLVAHRSPGSGSATGRHKALIGRRRSGTG